MLERRCRYMWFQLRYKVWNIERRIYSKTKVLVKNHRTKVSVKNHRIKVKHNRTKILVKNHKTKQFQIGCDYRI